MKSILPPRFNYFLVEDIKKHFGEESNAYITLGTSTDFGANSSDVPDLVYTINEKNQFFRNMVGAKKIAAADMQVVVPRIDWSSGTYYDAYADHVELYSYIDYTNLGSANANANTTLTGNANIAASNVVIGNGTAFLTYVFCGDQISVNGTIKTVVSVTNNEYLIVNSAYSNTNTLSPIVLIQNSKTVVANSAAFTGTLQSGNIVVIGDQTREVVSVLSNKVISLNTALKYSNSNISIQRKDNTYPFFANTFYVRNTRDQVFKCLFNGNSAPSTIEPTIDIGGQLPENPFILTSDGYKWKYLYTIPPGLKQKFFTNLWMPVVSDGAVTAAATEGRIDIVNVLWGGSGHINGGNSNTSFILSITGTDGQGANLAARVANGNITSVSVLTGGNNYTRGTVTVIDNDKLSSNTLGGTVNVSGTVIRANISNTANQNFVGNLFINDIVTVNGESRNVVAVTNATHVVVNTAFTNANSQVLTVVRSNAQFDIVFSPQGGHGSDPAKELGSHTVMVVTEFNKTENNTIPMSDALNVFKVNQVGILVDPLIANSAYTANLNNYRMSTRLFVTDPGILANFVDGETVYSGATLETATAVANVAHWDVADNYLYINNITGTFETQKVLKGEISGASVPILEISNSEIKIFSGDLIYMENRPSITRIDGQTDQVKIILSF